MTDASEGASGQTPDREPERGEQQLAWADRDHAALAAELGGDRAASEPEATRGLAQLLGIVWRLRDPDGCPWDRKQSLESMAKNLVEEAYEAVEAIAAGDDAHIAEELGDVLMNVLLMTRIGVQEQRFATGDVAGGIAEKLVRRHPHVFGDGAAADADEALVSWNDSKALEKTAQDDGVLGEVSSGLPPLLAARKLGSKAAETGFDWPSVGGALDKLKEEVVELDEALAADDKANIEAELGDVLFSAVNVARKAKVDPELALRRTLAKFRRRFRAVELELGDDLANSSLDEMERIWRRAADGE